MRGQWELGDPTERRQGPRRRRVTAGGRKEGLTPFLENVGQSYMNAVKNSEVWV